MTSEKERENTNESIFSEHLTDTQNACCRRDLKATQMYIRTAVQSSAVNRTVILGQPFKSSEI